MRSWMLRGLVYAAAMTVVRLIQGTLINAWQTQAGLISVVLLVLFVIGVVVWGVIDGRADARANPDPDRRDDLAMTWLLAGLVAGVLSGAVCWLIALVYKGLYTGGLINEITTFAAFTALIVFLPGIIGVTVGRWRVDRNPDAHRPAGAEDERADTDVFSAVRGDDAPTGEIPTGAATAQHEQQTSAVATAEREAPTETLSTTDDAKTEVIRTDAESGETQPEPKRD
ncbi:B-4DMT family transporter [Mycobacterium sp. 050134]|uniref:B-4DMT family transporter n=1 Tax=Mycobacterium sp. 050134 TaxID=3096111 RepID=UPI002ED83430